MYKCKICGKKYKDLACLYNHLESKHADVIPQNMSVQQFYYYTKTGKMNGNCVMCKHPTTWNMNTNKYNRFCGDPKCKAKYVEIMKGRMIAKYGKAHLLNDPNKQREMLANRSISGTYEWSDGKHKTTYTGSYELDFLKTLDNFFEWDPADISMPSPHTYTYEYEGERKFYIPDVFIHSLDLEIEIKDGGDNPNRHHKIQDVDKVKEKLKDEVLTSQRNFHYVKITNKNYSNFFDFLKEVKDGFEKYGDDKKIPRIFKTEDIRTKGEFVKESYDEIDLLEEGFARDVVAKYDEFTKKPFRESDLLLSLRYDLVKGSPKELQDFLLQLIKGAKHKDDLIYVNELVGKSETYYYNLLKKRPEIKGEYQDYRNWTYTGMRKEMKDKLKKIGESVEEFEFLEEKFEPDKLLVWLDKPKEKLLNKNVRLYHAAPKYDNDPKLTFNVGDTIQPFTITPGATKLSNPRLAMYFWDNKEYAMHWGVFCELRNVFGDKVNMYYSANTNVRSLMHVSSSMTVEEVIDIIVNSKCAFYIYETEVPANKLEIGSLNLIKEYTLSEPIKVMKKTRVEITKDILLKYIVISNNVDEVQRLVDNIIKSRKSVRGLAGLFMNEDRDGFRGKIQRDIHQNHNSIVNDELFNNYRKRINKSIKAGVTDRLLETPEAFDLLEEKFEPDKFLVWFDKPVKKLVGGKLRVYHGSSDLIEADEITPISFNVGATKHSDPRWSTYVWDNKEDAMKWASAWEVSNYHRETLYIGHNGKTMLGKPEGIEDKAFVKELINKMSKARFYIYECEVDIKDLEIGSCPSIKEYTISKPIKVLKRYDYTLNKEIVRRCFNILPVDEVIKFKDENRGVKHLKLHRNFILNHVLDNTRDSYRAIMRTDLQQGNIKVGDDLSGYKDSINHHVKRDTYGLKESYITDIMEESSISMVQLNLYLQNQYEEEMKHYLDTYKQYYEIMRKEKPHAVKNLNEDIKRAIIFIDGLASKGVENNLVQFAREELGSIVNIPKRGNAVKIHEATNVKGNVWVGTDWHFYKNKHGLNFKVNKHIDEILRNFNKHVKANDTFIFLGDLYDARSIFDVKMVPEIFRIKDLKGYKIMIKGNHDVNTNQFYLDLGFDEVYEHEYRLGNIVFSHEPVKVNDDEINIHGHIHFSNNYWDVDSINHLDAYIEHYNFKPVTVIQMIEEYRDTDKLSFKAINKFDKLTSIFESTDVLNIKLIYENSNARSLFGLADTKSQLVFNNEFIVKRDKMGNHCSVSILEETMNSNNIIEFEIKFNDLLDFDNCLKENMNEGITLNTMFNFRDEEYKFIKEACLKIFGSYPESINKK